MLLHNKLCVCVCVCARMCTVVAGKHAMQGVKQVKSNQGGVKIDSKRSLLIIHPYYIIYCI